MVVLVLVLVVVPVPVAILPVARNVLPPASTRSAASASAPPSLRRLASPPIGTPASTLRSRLRFALPRSAASAAGSGCAAMLAGTLRSALAFALSRWTARRHGESARPAHHTDGSKSTRAACAFTAHAASACACVAVPETEARAPPLSACRRRSSSRCGCTVASSSSCTLRVVPRSAAVPARRAFTSMLALSFVLSFALLFVLSFALPSAPALPPAIGPPTSVTGPLSRIVGARPSSSEGRSAASVASRFQPCGDQRPRPSRRPASVRGVPSSATTRRSSSSLGRSGRAARSSARRRSGSRASSQRPARALLRSIETLAGWSAAVLAAAARPLSAVTGAPLASAERSSACVLACSSPSGHAAKGRSVARASSVCAGCVADAAARSVMVDTGAASGPAMAAFANHAGSAADASCASATLASSTIGAALAMVALPLARKRSQVSARRSMRCSAPPFAPRCMAACKSRIGSAPSALACSSPMRSERRSSAIGRRRSAGAVSGAAFGFGAKTMSSRSALSESIVTRAHSGCAARSMRRPRQARAVSVMLSLPPGNRTVNRRAEKSPHSRPRGASAVTPGSTESSQAVPLSLRAAHQTVAAAAITSEAAAPAIVSTAKSAGRRRTKAPTPPRSRRAGVLAVAAEVAAGGVGVWSIRTRSRRSGARAPA